MNETLKSALMWLAGAAGLAILAMAIQFWIHLNVKSQLAEAGIVPKSTVESMQDRLAKLEGKHDTDTQRVESAHNRDVARVERTAQDIARILMEE